MKNGWLPEETYGPAARKAWIALTGYLTPDGDLREVCVGTGKKDDLQYYLDRPRAVGDAHGQAPMLWSASGIVEIAGVPDTAYLRVLENGRLDVALGGHVMKGMWLLATLAASALAVASPNGGPLGDFEAHGGRGLARDRGLRHVQRGIAGVHAQRGRREHLGEAR